MKQFAAKLDSFFKISERGSTISREIIGGLIIFLAMIYILPVNSGMLSETGLSYGSVFFATAFATGVTTLIMGILANYPIALAPGMGLNALMTYTVCKGLNYTYQEALCIVFVSGLIFLLISLTNFRKKVINAIPRNMKYAIGAGIGGFICLIGLANAGIITSYPFDTIVELNNNPAPAVYLAMFGVVLVFGLYASKTKLSRFAVIISMAVVAILGYILHLTGVDGMPNFDIDLKLGTDGVFAFLKGFGAFKKPATFALLFTFLFVDFFDTAGTLVTVGTSAGLVDPVTGEVKGDKSAFMTDAIGTVIGAAVGTSTVTSYIESATGVESGARTGLSACVTGILFLLSILIFPAFSIFAESYSTTSMALVFVGSLMFTNLRNIEWDDKISVASGFITFIMMMLCYSISEGMALGFLFYIVMMIIARRAKEVNPIIYGLGVLFVLSFVLKWTILVG